MIMGIIRNSTGKLPSFCLNRITTRVRVRSPAAAAATTATTAIESKTLSPKEEGLEQEPLDYLDAVQEITAININNAAKKEAELGRRIMVVMDSNPEAKTAVQWVLSHSVQTNDIVVLVDVVKPSKKINVNITELSPKERNPKAYEHLQSMKNYCKAKRPEVNVEISVVEGRERGPTIVQEARKQGVSLLVMGQRKRSTTWRLIMMWSGNKMIGGGGGGGGGSVAEYCIQNAGCMALAVRRKSRKGGGYLITTKRHKDFWLLA